MTGVVDQLAALLLGAGLVAAVAFALRRSWRMAAGAGLQLWMAAGLLRLSADPGWEAILAAAALIVLRQALRRPLLTPP